MVEYDTDWKEYKARVDAATASGYGVGTGYSTNGVTPNTDTSSATSTKTTTTKWEPSTPMPEYEAGEFEAPEYDEREVKAETQRAAAPGVRRLREQVQQAQAKTFDNPNVKGLTLKNALRGYGSGLENVMAGAYRNALADYNQKYEREWKESVANFEAQEAAKAKEFSAALEKWSRSGTQTTTSEVTSSETTPRY